MARDILDDEPIETRSQLIEWFEQGNKSNDALLIGTEHEKFPYYTSSLRPVPYEGAEGIAVLLRELQKKTGWEPILDRENWIGLIDVNAGAAISLEPGGQFELSGAPLPDIHAGYNELTTHLRFVNECAKDLRIGFLGLGMSPLWTLPETPVMPKQRYQIMADYMPKVGSRGLDMMFRTATVQANLDYTSERDMVRKLRVSLALQPLVTALFANSPFTDGKPNGFLSMRSEIWRNTDNQRTGMLDFAFEPGMGFERYVDYALAVPMYFIKRGDVYHDVAGRNFRDLLVAKLPKFTGVHATLADWSNHLGTIFPEVRLKRYLEMRGADCGDKDMILALPALCAGLLYDAKSLDGAEELIKNWTVVAMKRLRAEVPYLGLAATIDGRSLSEVGKEIVSLAEAGLQRRGFKNEHGEDESLYLKPLRQIVAQDKTLAQRWLEDYHGPWQQSVKPIFKAARL